MTLFHFVGTITASAEMTKFLPKSRRALPEIVFATSPTRSLMFSSLVSVFLHAHQEHRERRAQHHYGCNNDHPLAVSGNPDDAKVLFIRLRDCRPVTR